MTGSSEPSLTIYQEDCKKAGIRLELKLLTPAALWKNLTGKEYELCNMNWGALFIPNPETSWKGELADSVSNNNVTAFKNARVDELLGEYDRAMDAQKRIAVIREIDGIIYEEIPYVLGWYNPAQRFLIWNKFGMPPWCCPRSYDQDELWYSFWVDPEKEFTEILQRGRMGESGESYAFNRAGQLVSESRFDDDLRTIGLIAENERGILNVPDFIANAGGVICAALEYRGVSEGGVFPVIEEKVARNTDEVLQRSAAEGIPPREAAVAMAAQRVRRAMDGRRFSLTSGAPGAL